MITRSPLPCQTPDWRQELACAIRDPAILIECLGLDPALLPGAARAGQDFALLVPQAFVSRMRHGDPNDPLLRQVLPLDAEYHHNHGYTDDPLRERDIQPLPGLLHKYHGRALLITTPACAVHCRYCFRRHFPYVDTHLTGEHWAAVIEHLGNEAGLEEIILSGGDPLVLSDDRLTAMLSGLGQIPHLRRFRIHTRLPVVLPSRVTPRLVEILAGLRHRLVMVIHCNHPREIDAHVTSALKTLKEAGLTLLNQSVLLRGVNDAVSTLESLSKRLFETGVLPYYLHQLDPVTGAAHFAVSDIQASKLHFHLGERLPGYLVPKLVRDRPQSTQKMPVTPPDPS